MRSVRLLLVAVASIFAVSTAACGGDNGGDPPIQEEVNPAGTHHQYVMNQLLLPTNATQANQYGLVLDDNPQNRPNNALGQILSTLSSAGDLNLQEQIDEQVTQGSIIMLANMQATALTTATGVGVWVYLGANPDPEPCQDANDMVCGRHLQGDASFTISPSSPTDALVVGQNVGGQFRGGPGTVTIELSLVEGADSLTVDLIGARMEIGAVSETGLTMAKLGGAITKQDLDTVVLPTIVDLMADVVEGDCQLGPPDCCTAGSTGQTLVDLFDEDGDCEISLEELRTNSLIASLLAPDVDLLDCPNADSPPADCTFHPNQDGIKDSLSLGIGFTATGATFPR
jgi:hypothetical protein